MIRIIDVIYTDEPQMRPENAEFGVKVDFTRGQSDPVQVFSAMTDLLAGFVAMDRALAHSLDPESEALTVI